MDIQFTGPTSTVKEHFRQIEKSLTPTVGLARTIGAKQIETMRSRSLSGVDVNGSPYPPYSRAYAKEKRKRGGNGVVNLFSVEQHQHMLEALAVSVAGSDDTPLTGDFGIGIYDDATLELRLKVHNEGRGRMPKREVLGVSSADVSTLEVEAGQYLESRLRHVL